MEQEPAPRGSPQEPQGPDAVGRADDELLPETANTESFWLNFLP